MGNSRQNIYINTHVNMTYYYSDEIGTSNLILSRTFLMSKQIVRMIFMLYLLVIT